MNIKIELDTADFMIIYLILKRYDELIEERPQRNLDLVLLQETFGIITDQTKGQIQNIHTVRFELDILHFMVMYRFLMETNKGIDELMELEVDFSLFQDVFDKISEQLSRQYNDQMGSELEKKRLVREALFDKNYN